MRLPFTHDQFLDLFATYNRALWPALLGLWIVTGLALVRLFLTPSRSSRLASAVLVLHWIWSAAVYLFGYFRRINPAASIFAVGFLLEAGLLLWRGVLTRRVQFTAATGGWRVAAILLILYAMLYPVIGIAFGLNVPRLPSFGVPCPTTILTIGLLLLAPRSEARRLGVIPLLWAAIGGSAAFLLGIRADLALPVAGAVLLAYGVTRSRTAAPALAGLFLMLGTAQPAAAQSVPDKPYLPIGLFLGRIEEGARIFTPARMLPPDHPEAMGHAFPTLLQLHGTEFPALLWLGKQARLELWATLQRYPQEPADDWPYAEFRQPPDTAALRTASVTHRPSAASPLPGLRAVLYHGSSLILFLVDTRALTLEARGMKNPTTMGLDIGRPEFLAALGRANSLANGTGLRAVIFDP
jgi:hypothetical protein